MKLLNKNPDEYMAEYKEFISTNKDPDDARAYELKMAFESYFRSGQNLLFTFCPPIAIFVMVGMFFYPEFFFPPEIKESVFNAYPAYETFFKVMPYAGLYCAVFLLLRMPFEIRRRYKEALQNAAFYRNSVDEGLFDKYRSET